MADDIAVYGDMYVHYIGRDDRGEPVRRSVAPDVFAVFGTPYRMNRWSYVLWDEPEADMRFVLEIASSSTHAHPVTRRCPASPVGRRRRTAGGRGRTAGCRTAGANAAKERARAAERRFAELKALLRKL